MEQSRKCHPECVLASNRYHECSLSCLERLLKGQDRKHTKKQASKIMSTSPNLVKNEKESSKQQSLYAARPNQNSILANNHSPNEIYFPIDVVSKKTFIETKVPPPSPFSLEYERRPEPNNLVVDGVPGKQERDEKNDVDHREIRILSPRSRDLDEESNADEDDNDDEEIEIELDSCMSVGMYRVKPSFSDTLRSIIDKHGDIAASCKLESASMRTRYLECLCSLIQDLQSTPVVQLTKLKIKEMMAVLKDLDDVNIDVGWIWSVMEEFSQCQDAYREREKCEELARVTRQELEDREASLARLEKELAEARSRVEEARARAAELENERSRLEEIGSKVVKFKRMSFLDVLL